MLSVRLERGALWLALKNSKPDTDQAEYHKKRKKKKKQNQTKNIKNRTPEKKMDEREIGDCF